MRHRIPFVVVAALLAAACTAGDPASPAIRSVSQAADAKGDVAVTSNIADSDATVAPALQVRSDGLGPYVNSSTLTSIIQSIGDWNLDSYDPRGATRTVYVDFSQPIAGSAPNGGNPTPIPSGLYKVYMISKCSANGNSMLSLAPGATILCPLHIGDLVYGGVTYALQMNPSTAQGNFPAPETSFTNVTCTGGTSACTRWRLTPSVAYTTPSGATGYRNVAKLLKKVTVKNTTTTYDLGDFYVSFAITITNP